MTIENIDTVLEQLVRCGVRKIDWDDQPQGRSDTDGTWYVATNIDSSCISYDGKALKTRVDILHIVPSPDGTIGVIFDPVTRRIEALEIGETDFGGCLLRMLFWPGLEAAQELYCSTIARWQHAIENGWFDGL